MGELSTSEDNKLRVENHFGFHDIPFGVAPDPRFFYESPLYAEGLAALIHGIDVKKGFMLVTGEVGTGKTILLRKLMRQLEPSTRFIFVSTSHLTAYGLIEFMLQSLGLPRKEKTRLELIQELHSYLLDKAKNGQTVALLIDEGQKLSDDTLESLCDLSNLETDEEKLLQIVLVGQPELTVKLAKPALRRIKQRIALHHRLYALQTITDVEHYIAHRLHVSGYEGPEIFSKEASEAIWGYSGGTPRLINIICDNALALACGAGKKKVSPYMIMKVASGLLLERGVDTPKNAAGASTVFRTKSSVTKIQPKKADTQNTALVLTGGIKTDTAEAPVESVIDYDNNDEDNSTEEPSVAAITSHQPAVPPQFFDHMALAAAEAIGPMADLILGDQISALGESRDTFPPNKLTELIQRISREILNDTMRDRFETTMAREISAPPSVRT
jgi:type II secretory pathway predicted ATPase ExeA